MPTLEEQDVWIISIQVYEFEGEVACGGGLTQDLKQSKVYQ